MPTSWTHPGTTGPIAASSVTFTPNVGELLVLYWTETRNAAPADTSATASDTGSGGWTQIGFAGSTVGAFVAASAWWKVASTLDAGGITATVTPAGGGGVPSVTLIGVDRFGAPAGSGISADLGAAAFNNLATAMNLSPSVGSAHSGALDELAWACLGTNLTNGGMLTWTYTGTSPATNMATAGNNVDLGSQFVGGVQASATAGTNVWALGWNSLRAAAAVAATFVYSAAGQVLIV
jgi:hypothetical protein